MEKQGKVIGAVVERFEIVKANKHICLAHRPPPNEEWATWEYNFLRGKDINCFFGHYFDSERSALDDFVKRSAQFE